MSRGTCSFISVYINPVANFNLVITLKWFLQPSFKLNIASGLVEINNSVACQITWTSSTAVCMMITEVKYLHFCVFWWGYIISILCKQWWRRNENCFMENRQNFKWLIKRLGLFISLLGTLKHALGTAFKYAESFTILQLCKCWCISRRKGNIYCHVI